ncbi:MAG: hypothetical protein AB7Q42_10815 [Acidimicrobiia bacterium]
MPDLPADETSREADMDERITAHDGRMTAGRKGTPYDWQSVLAHHELDALLSSTSPNAASAPAPAGELVTR